MTDNQFDEFFRKKLGDHSSQFPGDMWQRIKQKKDKDRTAILLLVLLLLGIGGATSYFVFSIKQQSKENIASSQKPVRSNDDHALNRNKKDETINTQIDTVNTKEKKKDLLPRNDVAVKNTDGSENGTSAIWHTNKLIPAKYSKGKNIETRNTEKINENATKFSEQYLLKNTLDTRTSNYPNQITIKPNEGISAKQTNQKKSFLQKDSLLKNKKNVKTTIITIHKPIINNVALEVYLSPDIPISNTSSSNTAYLQRKDSTSKMELSYTAGLKLSALFGDHIVAKIGFQYSQINEKFNYANKNAVRTIPVVIERSLPDATGTMQTVLDTSNFLQAGTQYKLTYNHYKSIDVPILMGYETGSDRFKAAINAGMILNIKTSYNGDILGTSLNPVDIGSNNVYKSNTGVSLYLGLSFATRLNNNFDLFTEPYIRYRLNNMTGTYQSFRQKINIGGLSFGLRYNFKK
jgi:hypothetical protein